MSSIVHRSRNIRVGRSVRTRKETLDKDVSLDWSKGPRDNLKTILSSVCLRTGITNGQRLSYLHFFTKFCSKVNVINPETVGFSVEEILCCLRVTLFLESAEVRAAGLRAMRYLLMNQESVEAFYRINLHLLIARSLDIELNNLSERIQCLRLIRKLLAVKPEALPAAIIRCIVAIARDGFVGPDKDSMGRACMGVLAEITLLNPSVTCSSGGITALIDCILMTSQSLNISEALISCLLFLLNDPRLRSNLRKDIDLRQFVAPFTDCHYSLPLLALNTQRRDDISETSEQRETRLTAAKTALLSILRSWPGMLYICKLNDDPEKSSFNSLCSLIEMLHLPYRDIRKHLIELVFELFYLTIPVWTSNFTVALDSCNPTIIQDNWSLYDGFIAAEGRYLLPHISKERANVVDNYLSLLLYTFLTNGLLDGLVDVIIVPSDAENSVRAIILVGELLHLSSHLLPPELAQRYYTLPKLVEAALSSSNTPEQRDIASAAITCLNRMHATKKNRNIPYSLYLSQLVYFCKLSSTYITSSSSSSSSSITSPTVPSSSTTLPSYPYSSSSSSNYYHHYNNISTSTNATTTTPTTTTTSSHSSSSATSSKSSKSHPSSNQSLSFKSKYRSSSFYSLSSSSSNRKENDESTLMIYIRDSQVLKSDPNKWDWNLIGCILKSSNESMRKLDDANYRNFLRKLVAYFKPSSYCFSKLRSDDEDGHDISAIGTYLIDFLLDCDESRASEFINDLLSDIAESLSQVTRESNAVPDSILNCTNILRTWSHAYFLFIGRFTITAKGTKILDKAGIFNLLNDLITCSNNDSYMKLIVSSFNYCNSSGDNNLTRSLFIRILTCKMESARLYATNFMRILLRAGFADYKKWALGLLTQQLSDESQAVVLAAIDILDESCDSVDNLEALVNLQPNLLRVGDRGLLLLIRYLSIPSGYKFLRDTNFLSFEIDRWRKYFNLKYVRIVEDALNDALSYHQRNDNGSYGRRSDKRMNFKKNVHLPAHFYAELVKYDEGYNLIVQEHFLDPLYQTIREANISTELSVLQLKAALWAIGTVGSSPSGFQLLSESDIIENIVKLTCDSPILSIRGTSFYALGLLSTTDAGADFLKAYGWEAVRHTREDKWPLCREMIGANAQAGLFLYPHLSVKREHSWSVSSNATRITDICGVFSGKLKSLNPVNSFVYHGDDGQTPTDDVLYNSLPSFEAHNVFNELKSSILGKNFTSPQQLEQQQQPAHSHHQQSPSSSSSLAYHSSDLRPRSSSDSQRCNHDTVEDLPSSSTPDQRSGLWLRDDQIKEKSESHYANHPPLPTTSSHKKDGPSQNSLITIDHECSSKNLTSTSTNYFSPCSQQSTDSGLVRPSILSSNDRPRRKISEPGHYPTFISPDSLNERKDATYGNTTDSVKTVSLNAHPDSSSFESALKTGHQKQGYHKRSTSHDQTSHFRELYRSNRGYMGLRDTTLSSIPSAMDVRGYATLRSIQRKRNRSLGIHGQGLTKDEENALLDEYDKEDKAHLESMEVPSPTQQTSNTLLSPDGLSEIEDPSSGSYTMEAVRYMGICLPIDLELIFLKKDYPVNSKDEEEESDKPTPNLSQYHHVRHNDRYHSRVKHKPPPNMSNSRRGHLDEDGFEFHSTTSCLLCYHNKFFNHRSKGTSHSVKDSVINDVNNETDDNLSSIDKYDNKRKQTPTTTLQEPFFSSYASSSPETRGNSLPQNSKVDTIIEMRREVIRSVSYLLGWYEVIKLAEQNLLSLKQKYPAAFQDICLYSEISIQLASYNFRLPARRFLQELFMDLNFEQLYPDVEAIYERNKPLMKQYFDYTS